MFTVKQVFKSDLISFFNLNFWFMNIFVLTVLNFVYLFLPCCKVLITLNQYTFHRVKYDVSTPYNQLPPVVY